MPSNGNNKMPTAQSGPPTKMDNSKQNSNTLQSDGPDLQYPESVVWQDPEMEEDEHDRNI